MTDARVTAMWTTTTWADLETFRVVRAGNETTLEILGRDALGGDRWAEVQGWTHPPDNEGAARPDMDDEQALADYVAVVLLAGVGECRLSDKDLARGAFQNGILSTNRRVDYDADAAFESWWKARSK